MTALLGGFALEAKMPRRDPLMDKTTRGVILTFLYQGWLNGITPPDSPKTMSKVILESSLSARGAMPSDDDMVSALEYMEECEYVSVEWTRDGQRDYHSVTLRRKGIELYENPDSERVDAGVKLPPRRGV